jgi:hypothetical protein
MTTEENYINSDNSQRKLYDSPHRNLRQTHNSSFNNFEKIKIDFDFDSKLENQRPLTDRITSGNKKHHVKETKKAKPVVPPLKIVKLNENAHTIYKIEKK